MTGVQGWVRRQWESDYETNSKNTSHSIIFIIIYFLFPTLVAIGIGVNISLVILVLSVVDIGGTLSGTIFFFVLHGQQKRILIIDDDQDVTMTLQTVLEQNGFMTDSYTDPAFA